MITKRTINRLDNLVAKYSFRDWWATIRKRGHNCHQYSLSCETNEAREMLILAGKRKITLDEEAQVKVYMAAKIKSGEFDDIIAAETAGRKYDPSENFSE